MFKNYTKSIIDFNLFRINNKKVHLKILIKVYAI